MANDQAVGELERFLAERGDRLMRTAVLLTGGREAGQDLLQTALERLLRHWHTLDGDPEGYLRRTLYNLAADGYRRRGRLQRKLVLLRAQTQAPADATAQVDLRDATVSLISFEAALEDGTAASDAGLLTVAGYNEDDCRATQALRDWLNGPARELAHRDHTVDL